MFSIIFTWKKKTGVIVAGTVVLLVIGLVITTNVATSGDIIYSDNVNSGISQEFKPNQEQIKRYGTNDQHMQPNQSGQTSEMEVVSGVSRAYTIETWTTMVATYPGALQRHRFSTDTGQLRVEVTYRGEQAVFYLFDGHDDTVVLQRLELTGSRYIIFNGLSKFSFYQIVAMNVCSYYPIYILVDNGVFRGGFCDDVALGSQYYYENLQRSKLLCNGVCFWCAERE